MYNPWQVESIQAFSILKCPECFFDTKDDNKFEDHAVANHPMSYVLFGKSEKDINHSSVTNTECNLKDDTVQAKTFDKEDTEKYLHEENDIHFVEVNHIKEELIEDVIVEPLLDKDSPFSVKEDGNANEETSKRTPINEISKKMSDEKQKFMYHKNGNYFNYYCHICDYGSNYKGSLKTHMGLVHKLELSSDKEIAIELEKRIRKHFILDNTITEKVKLSEIGEESKEKSAVEKESLKESPVIDEEVCDDNFVEFGKIKNEPSENIVVSSIDNLDEQNPFEVSIVEKELVKESVQMDGEVCDDNFVEVGKIKKETTIEDVVAEPSIESLGERNPIEVSNENKSHIHLKKHIQCNICGLSFPKTTLQRHINEVHDRVHEEVYNYQCRLCNYGSDYKDCLKSHLKLLHNIEESKTELDKYRTGQAANEIKLSQEREERITKKQELIKCDQCELTIFPATKKSLNRHIATVHKQEQPPSHNCPNCSKSFDDVTQLEKHLECFCFDRRVKPKFAKPSSVMDPLSNDSLTSENYQCRLCDYGSDYKDCLESHLKSFHSIEESKTDLDKYRTVKAAKEKKTPQRIPKKEELIKCDKCEFYSATKKSLNRHIATVHIQEQPPFLCFDCEICGNSYQSEQGLEDHMLTSHHCSSCSKSFDDFTQLQTHLDSSCFYRQVKPKFAKPSSEMDPLSNDQLASEHGSVPMKSDGKQNRCHLCNYKHEKEIFLKIHLESHSRWNPISKKRKYYWGYKGSQLNSNLSCKQCEFVCEFKTSLKRHTMTFHGNRKYFDSAFKCKICGNGYKSNEGLTTHFSYEHYEHEKTPVKKLRSKLEKESSPKEISAESDKKQELKKIEEENVEIWDFENTVDSSVQKEPNVPNNLPAAQSPSIPENQPKKRNRKQTMAERQTF